MADRVLVAPSLFALSEALAAAAGTERAEWQERLAGPLRDPDGCQDWDAVGLAWWTGPGGKRHFRISDETEEEGPAVRRVYPERCFWRMRGDEREWVMACPCGAVVPPEKWAGTHCVDCESLPAEAVQWPEPAIEARLQGKRLLVRRSTGEVLLDRTEGDRLAVVRLADDGRSLAAATERDVLVWRMDDGSGELRLAQVLAVPCARLLHFRRDGSLLAATDFGVRAFSLAGEESGPANADRYRWPVAMEMTPDEGTLVLVSTILADTRQGKASLCESVPGGWRTEREVPLPRLRRGWLSPDARWLAWTGKDPEGVHLHDLAEHRDHGHAGWSPSDAVNEVRFVEGGLLLRHKGTVAHLPLAVFGKPRAASFVVSPEVAPILKEPPVHPVPADLRGMDGMGRVTALLFSPNHTLMACADEEAVRLVRIRGGELLMFCPLAAPVRSLAFSGDSRRLAFAGVDRPVVFDIGHGYEATAPFLHRGQEVWSLAFSMDGLHLHAVETHEGLWHHVSEWALRDGCWHEAGAQAVPGMRRGWLSRIARYLAWVDDGPGLAFTDLRDGSLLGRLAGRGEVQAVRFLPEWLAEITEADGKKEKVAWRERLGF